jgi:hypothetical protein
MDWGSSFQPGMCETPADLPSVGSTLSCKVTGAAQVTNPGSCTASAVSFPNTSPFQTRVDLCSTAQTAGACGAGKVCIPQGSGAAGESLCVQYDSVAACPAGWDTAITVYSSFDDTRTCSACTCGDGAMCGDSHYTFYDTSTCTSNSANGAINVGANGSNACTDVSSDVSKPNWSARVTTPQVHGNCPPGGGQPMGMVTTHAPYEYCCQ